MLLRLHYTRRYAFFAFFSAFQCLFFCFLENPGASNAIAYTEFLKDGSTVVSADASFELGFFSPGSSTNRFVGIWYKNIPVRTVVWVANREKPINDSSGSLMIDSSGNLVLVGKNNTFFWSTNSTKIAQKPVVELLDSGNLVLRDAEDGNFGSYLWQSFDYPTDTLLPGMKIGVNRKTGLDRRVIAWKNWDDPSPGSVFWKIQPHKIPESTVWKGNRIIFRTGPWNGISYSGTPQLKPNPIFSYNFVDNDDEVYYIFYQKSGELTSVVVNQTNNRQERIAWSNDSQSWSLLFYWPIDYCDTYALCGTYGICAIPENPVCRCMNRFKPRLQNKWDSGFWSDGCVRNKSLNCQGDGFNKFSGLKLPDTTYTWVNKSMDLKQCRAKCLENCSCSAYSTLDVRNGGSGCAIWYNDLIDIKQLSPGDVKYTQDLYVRVSASEIDELNSPKYVPGRTIIGLTIAVIVVVIGVLIVGYYFCRNQRNLKEYDKDNEDPEEGDLDLPLFDFHTVLNATSEFAPANKLGEGGFGTVYKGTLSDGQEIAVKRLSRNSGQGLEQFKNEVKLIAKLQHRNLVRLLGCCIQGEERLLIYEYMPNKSLDYFIFDQRRAELLDWSKRFNIICGIARGLLYLHQDSRLRIIHRDLKTSNVLLDNEMNPKISDFGMARFIGGDQTEGNTNRVVGTFGYMAPEYAADGFFSVKSDVFSFGVIMLEIISGKRNKGFYHSSHRANLTGFAWRLWKEENSSELIDTVLRESSHLEEIARCIHISLLCVQHHFEDRPSMASVLLMLSSENKLPQPKEPGFFKDKAPFEVDSSASKATSSSTNCEITISLLEPR